MCGSPRCIAKMIARVGKGHDPPTERTLSEIRKLIDALPDGEEKDVLRVRLTALLAEFAASKLRIAEVGMHIAPADETTSKAKRAVRRPNLDVGFEARMERISAEYAAPYTRPEGPKRAEPFVPEDFEKRMARLARGGWSREESS